MIVIIDYGMGNLRSVQKAIEKSGISAMVTQDPQHIEHANKIVLPGVGAMQAAMDRLKEFNLIDPILDGIKADKPFLGICLGLQLLFEQTEEGGGVEGLGILKGQVKRFTNDQKVPHMGWNQIGFSQKENPLFQGIDKNTNVYFCHSYYVEPTEDTVTACTTEYGKKFTSAVRKNNVFGVQFHPEKSQTAGLKMLQNFCEI